MPHPTRRFSKTRTLKRRSSIKAADVTMTICSNCGAPVLYHRVCPECGYYKGKPALEKTEKAEKKK
ncbi:MAG TPA: 50S ribosomal protein L32 [Bacteroidales bacterium]|nr:50S ribosomal protein L32 [Bacteroidales bacterium]